MTARPILLIDDESYWLDILQMMLFDLGHEAVLADNGRDGLELLKRNPNGVSLVLLDLMLPIMSGIQFLVEKAKYPELSHIPVILQTGSQNMDAIQAALNAGAKTFLQKPFDSSDLADILVPYTELQRGTNTQG